VKFLLLILAASFVPGAAIAQVSVNPAALMQLAGVAVPHPASVPETVPMANHAVFVRHRRHVAANATNLKNAVNATKLKNAANATKVKKPLPPVVVPVVARPAPVAPKTPAMVPVAAKPATAPVAPKLATAPAAPKPAPPPAPVDIAFATGSATLPAGAEARLAPFCKISGPIVINARAPADPDDNSQSMRLSLARALAVRASLSACGVASPDILPRALGAAPGGAPDVTQIQAGLNP
jgi:hypothetical protein